MNMMALSIDYVDDSTNHKLHLPRLSSKIRPSARPLFLAHPFLCLVIDPKYA